MISCLHSWTQYDHSLLVLPVCHIPFSSDIPLISFMSLIYSRVYSLRQINNALLFHVHNGTVAKNDHDYDDVTILKNYFQLDVSCTELFTEWSKNDKIFKESCHHCQGIRILSQDPIETLYAFICSSNNNIPRISLMMNRLCRHFGTPLGFYRDREFYDIPTFESLTVTGAEEKLRELGFGYRAKYITNAAKYILENHTKEWLYSLRQMDYEEAWQLLQTVPGVGPKVADCICLMGLGISQAVPVDTHIWRVAVKQYGLKVAASKSLTLTVYKQIGKENEQLLKECSITLKRLGDVR